MTIRLVHRTARTTRHLVGTAPRTIEAPPNLSEGKTRGAALVLMPIAVVMSSMAMMAMMAMMAVLCSGQYPPVGVVVLALTWILIDYDVLTTAGRQPLASSFPYVPSAPDTGLHFVVSRCVSGASCGLYAPFLLAPRESGTTGLIFSGDRTEGETDRYGLRDHTAPRRRNPHPPGRDPRLIQTALAPCPAGELRQSEPREEFA